MSLVPRIQAPGARASAHEEATTWEDLGVTDPAEVQALRATLDRARARDAAEEKARALAEGLNRAAEQTAATRERNRRRRELLAGLPEALARRRVQQAPADTPAAPDAEAGRLARLDALDRGRDLLASLRPRR